MYTEKEDSWEEQFPLKRFQIVGLWDIMRQFLLSRFCGHFAALMKIETEIKMKSRQAETLMDTHMDIGSRKLKDKALDDMMASCEEIGLTGVRASYFAAQLSLDFDPSCSAAARDLANVKYAIIAELGKRKFLWVDNALSQYVDNDELFGPVVNASFPSAQYDIKESGNCLATGCNTAAIFHLMRVAELGLRTVAWDRRVKFPKNSPLELKQWGEIFKGLEDAEKQIQSFPKTKARESQFEFYHGALIEFRAFKNLYRDRTDHARRNYDEYEARSAFEHVSSFMRILATKISEKKRTPLIWKKA
jgi:hypothetical protein